jgi:WD repeat-containing protein 23
LGWSYDEKLRPIPEFINYRENAQNGRRRPLRSRPVQRWSIDEEAEDTIW